MLGEILVEVAEEPGGQRRIGQVVDQRAVLVRGGARTPAAW